MSYLSSQPLHPDVSVQQWELFAFNAGVSMCGLLTVSSGKSSPQILWGFFLLFFLSSLIAMACSDSRAISYCLWKRLQAVSCYGEEICPLLGTKDECSFNSSTEEQNESKRLNVLGEGRNGEQAEAKHY